MYSVAVTKLGEFDITSKNTSHNDSPKPQQAIRSCDGLLVILIVLTGVLFFLLVLSIVQQNLAVLGLKDTGILSLKILDTSTSASLLVTLIGAILVRHQFALGLHPRITYVSTHTIKNHLEGINSTSEVWEVVLQNVGSGAAVINDIKFRVGFDAINYEDYSQSHKDIVQAFAEIGLIRNQDYWLKNISNGFTLSEKENWTLFEIKASKINLVKQLDAFITFQGLLGDRYSRELFLIPRSTVTQADIKTPA